MAAAQHNHNYLLSEPVWPLSFTAGIVSKVAFESILSVKLKIDDHLTDIAIYTL